MMAVIETIEALANIGVVTLPDLIEYTRTEGLDILAILRALGSSPDA